MLIDDLNKDWYCPNYGSTGGVSKNTRGRHWKFPVTCFLPTTFDVKRKMYKMRIKNYYYYYFILQKALHLEIFASVASKNFYVLLLLLTFSESL